MRKGNLHLIQAGRRTLLLDSVMHADSSWERMRGLLWRRPLGEQEALIIDRCACVHTWGMKYPLDIAFVDRQWMIRKLTRAVCPWRMTGCISAVITLEMLAGTIERLRLETGMQLSWQESDR